MKLNEDICYKALVANDPRFDGLFFVGVSSTGIYCRSVCPARNPHRNKCTYYPNAASAERQGYRPCLRCRPELAPSLSPFGSNNTIVPGIISRIQAGALNKGSNVDELAAEFDLSSRQIRRLLREEAGVSPIEYAQTCRLLLAKQLLTETHLPIIKVAYASGFSSLRRFNQSFLEHYRLPPSQLRKENGKVKTRDSMSLRLTYRPPFEWESLLAFLAPRAINGVEHVTECTYERTVSLGDYQGWLRVKQSNYTNALSVEISPSLTNVLQIVLAKLRDLFDLYARPDVIDSHLTECKRLAPLVRKRPGLRVLGAFDGFELAWRAILGQQVSVAGATTLAGRFAQTFGEPTETPNDNLNLFTPLPSRVAASTPGRIAKLGLPLKRAATLQALARLITDEPALLNPGRSISSATDKLLAIPGIGPWTTSYIAMRVLRYPDAFPDSDLGLKHALNKTSPSQIRKLAEPWRPFRAYAAMHLWADLS